MDTDTSSLGILITTILLTCNLMSSIVIHGNCKACIIIVKADVLYGQVIMTCHATV